MENILEKQSYDSIINRIENLRPDSQRQWGTMEPGQMLAHVSTPIEIGLGENIPQRKLFARIIGPLFKGVIIGKDPYKQNLPTDPSFKITEAKDFEIEKTRLVNLLSKFYTSGKQLAENRVHVFFGKMSADEWGIYTWKHLDHHLRQFGA